MNRRLFLNSTLLSIAAMFIPFKFSRAAMPEGHFGCPYCGRPILSVGSVHAGMVSGWCDRCCPKLKAEYYPQISGVWAYTDPAEQAAWRKKHAAAFEKTARAAGIA